MPEDNSRLIPAQPDLCGTEVLQHLLGKPLPDEATLEALDIPGSVRVIASGQPVTMDYIPMRLNIELDEDGTVQRLRCG